jgi:hypothetical protein
LGVLAFKSLWSILTATKESIGEGRERGEPEERKVAGEGWKIGRKDEGWEKGRVKKGESTYSKWRKNSIASGEERM